MVQLSSSSMLCDKIELILIQQAYFSSNMAKVKAYHECYLSISRDNEPNNICLMVIIYGNTRYLGASVIDGRTRFIQKSKYAFPSVRKYGVKIVDILAFASVWGFHWNFLVVESFGAGRDSWPVTR